MAVHTPASNFIKTLIREPTIRFVKLAGNEMRSRKEPEQRKQEILNAAIELSKEIGYSHITRDGVAERAGTSYALVSVYYGTIDNLKSEVLKEAIKQEILEIIGQGLARKDKQTARLPLKLKRKVLQYLSK
jgi:AcrR family transcriptional regulator